MVRTVLVFLPIFTLLINKINVSNAVFLPNSFQQLISNALGQSSNDPLVVLIDVPSESNSLLRSSDYRDQYDVSSNRIQDFDDSIDEKKTLRFVSEILRSTGDEDDPDVIQTNLKFENALRSRCQALVQCKQICEPKKKKPKYCPKSCKAVFDYLMMCDPPGGKKKEKPKKKERDPCEDSDDFDCGTKEKERDPCAESEEIDCKPKQQKYGKTLPPKW